MPFHQKGAVRYFQLEILQDVCHAFTTRHGGVSVGPWSSLNVGGTVGDEPQCVKENKTRLFRALGRSEESVFDVWQVHGDQVVLAEKPRSIDEPHQQADAIITNRPGLTLFMRFADCVPILLWDPVENVIGIVHAGWKGTGLLLAKKTVEEMGNRFRSKPKNILAGIGPSIGPHHYEIRDDVVKFVERVFGSDASQLLNKTANNENDEVQFDLWKANQIVLEKAGVNSIEIARICTACETEDWFSHRGQSGRTGRFGVMIGLESPKSSVR